MSIMPETDLFKHVSNWNGTSMSLMLRSAMTGIRGSMDSLQAHLEWETHSGSNGIYDVELVALALNKLGTVVSEPYFVFFNEPQSPEGALQYSSEGNVKRVSIKLTELPLAAERLVIAASIYGNDSLVFGQFKTARISLRFGDHVIVEHDLAAHSGNAKTILFGELFRFTPIFTPLLTFPDGDWHFNVKKQAAGNLDDIARRYGVNTR